MMKGNQRKISYIILFILCLAVGFIIWGINYNAIDSFESAEKKLYALDKNITEAELKKMGYIDITGVLAKKNEKIHQFLHSAAGNQKAILKTFQKENEELIIRIFYSEPKLGEIRTLTCEMRKQALVSPDKRFSPAYETIESDNIVTVILVNVKNNSLPEENQVLEDEVLYSYAIKK